jgi:AIPR protein
MAELHHLQIKTKLQELVVPKIDATDLVSQSSEQKNRHVLSRAVALVAIKICSQIEDDVASKAIVDGGADNGIDAIHYDATSRTLYICQSKWSDSHGSSVDSAGVLKFLAGVQDLVSLKKNKFNQKIQDRWSIIEDALSKLTSVRLVIAYPGSAQIDATIAERIEEFLTSQNETSELFFLDTVRQPELFRYFLADAAPPQIDLTIRLSHWGRVESPLVAVYGQVSASDLAAWYKANGNQLFAGNIRNFLGLKSDVNDAIAKTLSDYPSKFWYFNNGITIICESLQKQAIGGNDRSVGLFDCKKVTIVNGAQTVGTIGRTLSNPDSPASLQARIIVVSDPSSELWQQVTRASNTQNRIDARNFVALDPEQERIRTELLMERVSYEYREGETLDSSVDSFDFIEAITTLACAGNDISNVALAKGYIGGLFVETSKTPYKSLFNAGTKSKLLWSLVSLSRRIDKAIKDARDQTSVKQRGIVVHGNRFLSHCMFSLLSKTHALEDSSLITDADVAGAASRVLNKVTEVVEAHYDDAYPAPLFKNVKKCTTIMQKCGF